MREVRYETRRASLNTHVGSCCFEKSIVVPASDVYSLGLVFYQLITGQAPPHDVEAVLGGKGPAIDVDLLIAKLSGKGTPDSMSDPVIAAQVIARMYVPNRSDRYATLAEALDDLSICEP